MQNAIWKTSSYGGTTQTLISWHSSLLRCGNVWASLSKDEIISAKAKAETNEQSLKNGLQSTAAFPLSTYNPKRCPVSEGVHVRTRQDLPLGPQRDTKTPPELVDC